MPRPSPSPSLLEGKFQPQLGARAQVLRARLALPEPEALLAGTVRAVTVVAPTGYGKSTLMAQWFASLAGAARQQVCVAWLNLDENDNDPPRLLRYLYGALGRCVPTLAADAIREISRTANLSVMLEDLSLRLAAHERPIVLFLDDAHVLNNPDAIRVVEWLMCHAGAGSIANVQAPASSEEFRGRRVPNRPPDCHRVWRKSQGRFLGSNESHAEKTRPPLPNRAIIANSSDSNI